MSKRSIFVFVLIFLVLLIDQSVKVWIKLNMSLYESFNVMGWDWFQIYFTENIGMAFGIEFGDGRGKLALSLFRIATVSVIAYIIHGLVKQKVSYMVLASISLIFAGAVGNIIDSAIYGVLFSESTSLQTATFMPADGGYAPMLHGKVVDMFYFPLIDTTLPNWVPFWGGQQFRFFQAIFNVADAAICTGVGIIIVFYKQFAALGQEDKTTDTETENAANSSEISQQESA